MVFALRKKVIFVHGCFWHGHTCRHGRTPSSNQEYWSKKLARNKERDEAAIGALIEAGWRALIIWECETSDATELAGRLKEFLGQ